MTTEPPAPANDELEPPTPQDDPTITWQAVESTNVASIGHQNPPLDLYVQFTSSGVYRYAGVPLSVLLAFRDAESKGRYFAAHIRGKYPTTKVSD